MVFLGSSLGSYAAVKMLGEIPSWAQELIKTQGSDFMVAFAFIIGSFFFAPRLITALKDQAVALASLADGVRVLPQKDSLKFEEILIGQEMLNGSIDRMHEAIRSLHEKLGSSSSARND